MHTCVITSRTRNLLRLALCAAIAAIVLPATAQPVKLARGGERLANTDRPGSDLAHFEWDAPAGGMLDMRENQCAEECGKNKDCVAWTYVKPNTIQGPKGNCWLKGSVPAAKPNSCCTSATIAEVDVDRAGSDYSHFTDQGGQPVTASLCLKACLSDVKCKAWTFVKPNTTQGPKGVCWLKTALPPPTKNGCCMSGYFETQVIK